MSQAHSRLINGGQTATEERVKPKRTTLLGTRLVARTFSRTFKY